MFNPYSGTNTKKVYDLTPDGALDEAAAGPIVSIKPIDNQVTAVIVVASGSARSVSLQGSLDGTNFFDVGTTRTTTGTFIESVPGLPHYRLNLASTTGSTASAKLYG